MLGKEGVGVAGGDPRRELPKDGLRVSRGHCLPGDGGGRVPGLKTGWVEQGAKEGDWCDCSRSSGGEQNARGDGSRDTLLWRVLPLAGCVMPVKKLSVSEPLHP